MKYGLGQFKDFGYPNPSSIQDLGPCNYHTTMVVQTVLTLWVWENPLIDATRFTPGSHILENPMSEP